MSRALGWVLLSGIALAATFAPALAPNPPEVILRDRAYAPPTALHVRDGSGWHAPYFHPQQLADRVARRFVADTSRRAPVRWFAHGRVMSADAEQGPLLVLGADVLGRDVFSRLLHGARVSLGAALLGAAGALLLGAFVGGLAGVLGGRAESALMLVADFVLVLPAAYLVLALRGALPLDLPASAVFALMTGLFALAGWPPVARGVCAILAAERRLGYAEATRAAGGSWWHLLRQLLPATRGFLAVQLVLLIPALLLAEVTVSFLGLGFMDPVASWGTMLRDLGNVRVIAEAPWMLAPALAVFVSTLAVQLVAGAKETATVLSLAPRLTPGVQAR